MVEKTTLRSFGAIDDGTTDWESIRNNFKDLEDVIKDHYNEIKAIAQRQTFSVSGMYQTRGRHTLLSGGRHLRCKPINAYAVVHDNIPEEIKITINGLTNTVKFSDTELKGAGKSFQINPNAVVHFSQNIEIELSTSRRVSVYVTFESLEEGV